MRGRDRRNFLLMLGWNAIWGVGAAGISTNVLTVFLSEITTSKALIGTVGMTPFLTIPLAIWSSTVVREDARLKPVAVFPYAAMASVWMLNGAGDRRDPSRVLVAGSAGLIAGALLAVLSPGPSSIFLVQSLFTLDCVIANVAGSVLLVRCVPSSRRAFATTLYTGTNAILAAVAVAALGLVIDTVSYGAAFALSAAASAAAAILAWRRLQVSDRPHAVGGGLVSGGGAVGQAPAVGRVPSGGRA